MYRLFFQWILPEMVAHGVITVLLLAHFQWIFFLLNAPLLGWLVYRWVNLVFFKVYMTDIFFICSMEATWYFDMEIQKIKWDIVVFSLHFSHLKTLNFTSGHVRNRWGQGFGTRLAVTSKQECRSTYLS